MSLNLNCITGHNDHLYKRIQQSIHTATSIDIIVSFLMESGVKLIQKDLEAIKEKAKTEMYKTKNKGDEPYMKDFISDLLENLSFVPIIKVENET
mgnify:CR=1 FL=1